jgi:PHD/YefM family antitoxin component YafN of YafNO toxin-antitoxin module
VKNLLNNLVYQLLPESRKPIEVETKKSSEKLKEGHQAADLLIKLKDLKDAGVISAEEFDQKKKELLARI